MPYFRITLHRSAIGLPERTKGVLMALGLRKRTQTVYHPVSPQFAGMIMKVKELVKVEEVDRALDAQEQRALRRPDPGFWVERRENGAPVLGAGGAAAASASAATMTTAARTGTAEQKTA